MRMPELVRVDNSDPRHDCPTRKPDLPETCPLARSPVWVDLIPRRQTVFQHRFAPVALELSTFGSVALRDNAAPVLQGRRKVLALLAYLAHAAGPVDRVELARRFWPASDEARAKHSLRQALSELRSVLGEGLEIGPEQVRIRREVLTLDTTLFGREIADQRWTEALARWQGDFLTGLEDVGDEGWRRWLAREREGLNRQLALAQEATGETPAIPEPSPAGPPPFPTQAAEHAVPVAPRRDFSLGQLGTLSTESRALLETAAVIGLRSARPLLCRVAGLSQAGFESALAELSTRNVFFASTPQPGQYEFASVTTRQRIYDVMAGARRRALHAAVSDALAHGFGEDDATTSAEHHALLSIAAKPPTNWAAVLGVTLVGLALLAIVLLVRL